MSARADCWEGTHVRKSTGHAFDWRGARSIFWDDDQERIWQERQQREAMGRAQATQTARDKAQRVLADTVFSEYSLSRRVRKALRVPAA